MVFYGDKGSGIKLEVQFEKGTIWLTQKQLAELFKTERSVIGKHIKNVFREGELLEKSNVQKMHIANSDKPVQYYGLDVIISVGYRVNSKRATQFRIWATNVLRRHLVDGYTINQKLLKAKEEKFLAFQRAIKLIETVKASKPLEYREAMGLLDVIRDYSRALGLLDDYDYGRVAVKGVSRGSGFRLTYELGLKAVAQLRAGAANSALFGREKDESFASSVAAIYQTFSGKELYASAEEKAAHLLYFIVKNHSFVDGNKRIAAALFLWFLEKNRLLYHADGSKRVADNALVALTLMIAESAPADKDLVVRLVVNLINKEN
ncbi:MAG: cytochrome C biogenesis protein CycH [Elusimicrobia bacterium GWA2_62_23]|nr:MAG: cytochrome C biogenesis protein CycH [Elusimicrobia bacterium GWA2_62_23]OGR66668.1 MAG: cytochrome C biogenesis protein CycH [Elusimicrobia bacterium GWC2_63_65]